MNPHEIDQVWNAIKTRVVQLIEEQAPMWRDDGVDLGTADIFDILGSVTKDGRKITIGSLSSATDADTLDTLHAVSFVTKALYDAQTVLAATADNTPAAVVINEQHLLGRLTGGNIGEVDIGIGELDIPQIVDATVADDDWARFTATGLEGLTNAEVVSALSILTTTAHTTLGDGAPHHARYTDAEAVTAAKTVKLDDFTAPDDNTDLNASTSKHGLIVKAVDPVSAGQRHIVCIDAAEAIYKCSDMFDATHPANLGTPDEGASVYASHRDHVHLLPRLDDLDATEDNTDLDASTTKHGLLLKATAPAAGLYNYVGITNGETAYTNKALFDATVPDVIECDDAAAAGTAAVAARRDHTHGIVCAAPGNIDGVQAANEGAAASFARSDHAHRIQHGIADNAIVTVDQLDAAVAEYVRFTANGIEGRTEAEFKGDFNLEDADITTLAKTVKLDDLTAPDDNTDLDVSTSKHGLAPKAPNDTTKFLRGDGTWAVYPTADAGMTDETLFSIPFALNAAYENLSSGNTVYATAGTSYGRRIDFSMQAITYVRITARAIDATVGTKGIRLIDADSNELCKVEWTGTGVVNLEGDWTAISETADQICSLQAMTPDGGDVAVSIVLVEFRGEVAVTSAFDDATSDPLACANAANDGDEDSAARKDHVHPTGLTVEEADGLPTVANVVKIKVSNGTLTDDGSGVVSVAIGAGSGGHVIQDDDVDMTARSQLSFQDGFTVTDDAGGDQTEIDVDIGIAQNKLVKVSAADAADDDYAKFTATGLEGRSYAEVRSDLNVEDGADVTDATNVAAAGAVMEADYNAQTILAATADNTPAALEVAEQRIVGRKTGGNIAALTAAEVIAILAPDSDDVTYAPTTAADWDGAADPGDVEQALDQLADRLADGRLWIPASAMWPATDNGCAWPARRESATSRTNVFYCAFDPTTDEYAEFTIVLPLWDQGTIDVTYYWTTVASAGTTVVWGIAAQSLANDDSLDTAYAAATYADADTVLAAADVHIIADTGITVAGAGAGELIMCRVTRDPDADTCASDADLLGIVITYGRRDA